MKVVVPRETAEYERRVACVPDAVKRLLAGGLSFLVLPRKAFGKRLRSSLRHLKMPVGSSYDLQSLRIDILEVLNRNSHTAKSD